MGRKMELSGSGVGIVREDDQRIMRMNANLQLSGLGDWGNLENMEKTWSVAGSQESMVVILAEISQHWGYTT